MVIIIELNKKTSSLPSTPRPLAVVVATRARTSSKSQTGQIIARTKYFFGKIILIKDLLVKLFQVWPPDILCRGGFKLLHKTGFAS